MLTCKKTKKINKLQTQKNRIVSVEWDIDIECRGTSSYLDVWCWGHPLEVWGWLMPDRCACGVGGGF